MTGWGMNMVGLSRTLDALDSLRISVGTDAVYVTGASVEYAVYQETGTSKMEANPFLQPAVRDARRNLDKITSQASSGDDLIRRIALYIERRAKHYATSNVPPGPDVQSGDLRASISSERIR